MRHCVRIGFLPLAVMMLCVACDSDPFGDLGDTVGGTITNSDTSLFLGTTATFTALAEYGIGPGVPLSVSWGTNDTTKLGVIVSQVDLSARVTALDTGEADLIVLINGEFRDSISVVVVGAGQIRWRRTLSSPLAAHAAVTDSGDVLVLDQGGTLRGFSPDGDTTFTVGSCEGMVGPAIDFLTGTIAATGTDCTRLYDPDGLPLWSTTVNGARTAPAIAANGDVVVLTHETGPGGEAVGVVRLAAATGAAVWRDTLDARASLPLPQSSPAVAGNGIIYVAWHTTADSAHLTSLTGAGTPRWTVPVAAPVETAALGLAGGRIIVGMRGGVAAYDTASGDLAWHQTFPTDAPVSSPVVDQAGNVYVQSADGLMSLAPDGSSRWTADSLGVADATGGVGATTLVGGAQLIVPCGTEAVCGVDAESGALLWRTTGVGVVGSPAVSSDGSVYVATRGGDLVALWGSLSSPFGAWVSEGGGRRRSRRQP